MPAFSHYIVCEVESLKKTVQPSNPIIESLFTENSSYSLEILPLVQKKSREYS